MEIYLKYHLALFTAGFLGTLSHTANAQQCPEITDLREFSTALDNAILDQSKTRKMIQLDGKYWFLPLEDWKELAQPNVAGHARVKTDQVTLKSHEEFPDKLRCIYTAKRYAAYGMATSTEPVNYVYKDFKMTNVYAIKPAQPSESGAPTK